MNKSACATGGAKAGSALARRLCRFGQPIQGVEPWKAQAHADSLGQMGDHRNTLKPPSPKRENQLHGRPRRKTIRRLDEASAGRDVGRDALNPFVRLPVHDLGFQRRSSADMMASFAGSLRLGAIGILRHDFDLSHGHPFSSSNFADVKR